MTNLQPKQFYYHASNRDLTPGKDQILPANDDRVGGSHYGYSKHDGNWGDWEAEPDGSSRGDWTFAADTEVEAEAWKPAARGRGTVYVVKPRDDTDIDFETHHHMTGRPGEDAHHIKAKGPMDIVDRIDIPRPHDADWSVQGTLPPIDWQNRYQNLSITEASRTRRSDERDQGVWDYGNSVATDHTAARRRREQNETYEADHPRVTRAVYEGRWKKAGQQRLDL